MFSPFHDAIASPADTVAKYRGRLGRPAIGVMPAYFPLELIHAAGGYPVQIWGASLPIEHADAQLQSYCCSVARSALELEMRGAAAGITAYVFTSLCDTLVNLREIYRRLGGKPVLEFSIPATLSLPARGGYLAHGIAKLARELEALTGSRVSPGGLRESAAVYGRMRGLQRDLYRLRRGKPGLIRTGDFYAVIKAGFFLPVEEYGRLLEALLGRLGGAPGDGSRQPRLVLSGMVFDPLRALAAMDGIGVHVVDDDFASGWRSASRATLQVEDLTQGVAEYLFQAAPCCCIHNPANDRHAYLVAKVRDSGADGVLFWGVKFCEPDAFDRPQLLARLEQEGIRAMVVEVDLSLASLGPITTRIEAFAEMLGGLEELL